MEITEDDAFLSQFITFDELCAGSHKAADSLPDADVPHELGEQCTFLQPQHQSNPFEVDIEMPLAEFRDFDVFECDLTRHGLVPAGTAIALTIQRQEQDLAHSAHSAHDAQYLDVPSLSDPMQISQLDLLPVDQSLAGLLFMNNVRFYGIGLRNGDGQPDP
ncbi:uncharacterized protein Z519_09486 [Cladophialophora bantiana CBS 173.52]|uniref:Uncharacterized protein n=1 Tax=Cladophialophora bantiana (strain ATCC 10958 / CBS 173.52 / CDC B-1940 / NIH 8579) TaxID=1442370 RepID=A0A0D2HH26_CLAB1|nr:uncharacterized protein Z519_09486 [Cladophialophora bantiana CBS 173.52]KIW90055.1 hypothetical protein Z519_09486 [Cladophialophora bantiana CBS 173.52]